MSVTDIFLAAGNTELGVLQVVWAEAGTGAENDADKSATLLSVAFVDEADAGCLSSDFEKKVLKGFKKKIRPGFEHSSVQKTSAQHPLFGKVLSLLENPISTNGFLHRTGFTLGVKGTAFQQRVWDAIAEIPPGRTLSYTQLAGSIGAPKAVRAVASACAANQLALVIPCHRVVAASGKLSGYRWGIERKRWLLQQEAERFAPAG